MPKLIEFTKAGLYCPPGDFYIDPWRATHKAIITHGHSDHARSGHKAYLCHHASVPVLQLRLGPKTPTMGVEYGEILNMNGVKVSLHPAGHIIGSAMVRVEYKGEVWVASGDYKLENDGISAPWEPVACHHFITESTFGMPVFRFPPQAELYNQINHWWKMNREAGKKSILIGYSLGKAQRLLKNIDRSIGPVFLHPAVHHIHETLIRYGIPIPHAEIVSKEKSFAAPEGSLVIAPPTASEIGWMRKFSPHSIAVASGWMNLRGTRRRQSADRGFPLSDHCDWDQLNTAIKACGAENIYVTHGYTEVFSEWLKEKGYNASIVKTEYAGDDNPEEKTEG